MKKIALLFAVTLIVSCLSLTSMAVPRLLSPQATPYNYLHSSDFARFFHPFAKLKSVKIKFKAAGEVNRIKAEVDSSTFTLVNNIADTDLYGEIWCSENPNGYMDWVAYTDAYGGTETVTGIMAESDYTVEVWYYDYSEDAENTWASVNINGTNYSINEGQNVDGDQYFTTPLVVTLNSL